jgi:hypothetical protein
MCITNCILHIQCSLFIQDIHILVHSLSSVSMWFTTSSVSKQNWLYLYKCVYKQNLLESYNICAMIKTIPKSFKKYSKHAQMWSKIREDYINKGIMYCNEFLRPSTLSSLVSDLLVCVWWWFYTLGTGWSTCTSSLCWVSQISWQKHLIVSSCLVQIHMWFLVDVLV